MTNASDPAIQTSQPHPRRFIRAKMAQLLKAGTDLGQRWWVSRPNPLFLEELPCGLIYFTEEESDHHKTAPRTYDRICHITTEVLHEEETDRDGSLDDYLDSRAWEIERAIQQHKFLQLDDFVQDVILRRTSPATVEFEGRADVASLRLFWDVEYSFDAFTPESLDEFLRFTSKLETVEPGAKAEDNVTIRTE